MTTITNPGLDLAAGLDRVATVARQADLPDPAEIVRGMDLPSRLETGRELMAGATTTLAKAVGGARERRRPSRRRRAAVAIGTGLAALVATFAWRSWHRSRTQAGAAALDRTELDRAADEGMVGRLEGEVQREAPVVEMAVPDEPVEAPAPAVVGSPVGSWG